MEFDNFMSIMEINAQRFGVVNHKVEDGNHTLNTHHGISDNFSCFLACANKKMANDFSLKMKVTNSDKNILCTLIEEPNVK